MSGLAAVLSVIKNSGELYISCHERPDGDAIGSMLALGLGLESIGIEPLMIMKDHIPAQFQFLPGAGKVKTFGNWNGSLPRIGIILDCGDLERIGYAFVKRVEHSLLINIDHHVSNKFFGEHSWVDHQAGACGEMIFRLLEELNVKITPDIATNLMTAIITDTGNFLYSNTTPESHRIAARLMEHGADTDSIREQVYQTKSLVFIRLLGEMLNNLQFHAGRKIVWTTVTREMMDRLGAKEEDLDGLVSYLISIEGVEVAIFFTEMLNNKIKVGLRSRRYVNVNLLAEKFGGGGHMKAAGCVLSGSLPDAVSQMLAAAEAVLQPD